MAGNKEGTQVVVDLFVRTISDYFYDIKTTQNWIGQTHVVCEIQGVVILALQGVGCGYNAASGSKLCNYTCFGDGNGLLLHSFVDGCSVMLVHFVELVDETKSTIGKYHCSSF